MATLLTEHQQYPQIDPLHDFSNFIDNVGLTLDSEGSNLFQFSFCADESAIANDQNLGSNNYTSGSNERSNEEPMSLLSHGQEVASNSGRDGHAQSQVDGTVFPGMTIESFADLSVLTTL